MVYEWTGKCRSCQGSGYVSYYNKRGKEVPANAFLAWELVMHYSVLACLYFLNFHLVFYAPFCDSVAGRDLRESVRELLLMRLTISVRLTILNVME